MTDTMTGAVADRAAAPVGDHNTPSPNRRTALIGICTTCAGALAGCATGRTEATAAAPGTAVAPTSDIPSGGGKIFGEYDLVVTQPTPGAFAAFSATCTHQGCLVASVEGGTINCPYHGSRFAITDGTVTNGPASPTLTRERDHHDRDVDQNRLKDQAGAPRPRRAARWPAD